MHGKAFQKRRSAPINTTHRASKLAHLHSSLELMLRAKVDRYNLSKALAAKVIDADQKDAIREFMVASLSLEEELRERRICRILHPWLAQEKSQISVIAGEMVQVVEMMECGWWVVLKVDSNSEEVKEGAQNGGTIPGLCCDWRGEAKNTVNGGGNEVVIGS